MNLTFAVCRKRHAKSLYYFSRSAEAHLTENWKKRKLMREREKKTTEKMKHPSAHYPSPFSASPVRFVSLSPVFAEERGTSYRKRHRMGSCFFCQYDCHCQRCRYMNLIFMITPKKSWFRGLKIRETATGIKY